MLWGLLLVALVGTTVSHGCNNSTEPIVSIKQGTIRGVIQTTLLGRRIYSFKGLRYAKAPVGNLRFKPPVPPESWEGVYDATKDGPACPQPDFSLVAEDCLFINVHTPKIPREKNNPRYNVILYVHPGSLNSLTGNSAAVGPQYLLDKDVVLVSFNYRLGSLGLISTGDEHAPGNNALKDQVQAMRWVQENIAAFGGNPNSVTLAGYSAGGFSVAVHMVSPMAQGLFNKVMIMSGSVFGNFLPLTHQFNLAQKQADLVGCPNSTSAEIIDCLKTVPGEDLGNSLGGFRVFGNDPGFIWQMVIEPDFGQERYIVENPHISIQCGRIAQVPVMTGITVDELVMLADPVVENSTWLDVLNKDFNNIAPYAFYYEPNTSNSERISNEIRKFYFDDQPINSNSLEPLGEVYSDSLSGYAVNRGAKLFSKYLQEHVYYYIFTYKGQYSNFNPLSGNNKYVVHFDDLLYVFWNSLTFPMFNVTDPDVETVKKMVALYANFAATGNPTPRVSSTLDRATWEPFTRRNKKYLDIGKQLVMKRNVYPDRYRKWDTLVPMPSANCQ